MAEVVYEMTYAKFASTKRSWKTVRHVAAQIAERLKEARSHGDVTENPNSMTRNKFMLTTIFALWRSSGFSRMRK